MREYDRVKGIIQRNLTGEKVICSSRIRCKEKMVCGGAQPHDFDPGECGKCPLDHTATCEPIVKEGGK